MTFYSSYKKRPTGAPEVIDDEYQVDVASYRSTEQEVMSLLRAGVVLDAFRRGSYDDDAKDEPVPADIYLDDPLDAPSRARPSQSTDTSKIDEGDKMAAVDDDQQAKDTGADESASV